MDTYIFSMKIDVASTSAYITIASLLDEGAKADLSTIKSRWPDDYKSLDKALAELLSFKIVNKYGTEEEPVFTLNPPAQWRFYKVERD